MPTIPSHTSAHNQTQERSRRQSREAEYAKKDMNEPDPDLEAPTMSLYVSLGVIFLATGLTYLTAEALTESLQGVGEAGGVSTEWLGLIVLAIASNCTLLTSQELPS